MTLQDLLTGLALVLVIEGLVYALAPHLVERMLTALREMPEEMLRMGGLAMVACGVAMIWGLYAF